MLKKNLLRMLPFYLAFIVVLVSFPASGWAMFVPAGQDATRQADLKTVQKTLESTVITQRLMDYGLSPDEALARVNTLSDAQLHQFATKLDSLQAGGHHEDTLIILILALILLVLIV